MDFEILDSFLVSYDMSSNKNAEIHAEDNWRNKYLLKIGYIWIVKHHNRQYFQWQPLDDNGNLLLDKGLVSSEDDYIVSDNKLTIITQNSIYYFTIQDTNKPIVAPPILW